jgi:hypothetical protein
MALPQGKSRVFGFLFASPGVCAFFGAVATDSAKRPTNGIRFRLLLCN